MVAPFCTGCGAAVAEGVRFCVKCGQPVGQAAPPPPAYEIPPQATIVQPAMPLDVQPEKSGIGAGVWIVAVFGILLVLGGAALLLYSKRAKTVSTEQAATAPPPVTSAPAPAPSIPTTPEAIPPNPDFAKPEVIPPNPDFAKKDQPPPPAPTRPRSQPVESQPPVDSPAPVPPRPLKPASATSGRLHASVEVAQNGEVVFENLPGARLKFTFDHEAWQSTISRQANGTQTLVMRSLRPGIQRSCDVQWEIVQ